MSSEPNGTHASTRKRTPLHWLGVFFLVLGASLVGAFLSRQFKESGTGHTYYEFMAGGALLAVTGVGMIISARRR